MKTTFYLKTLSLLLFLCFISLQGFCLGDTFSNYRWRNDDGSETLATWKADINTSTTLTQRNQNIRLRIHFKSSDYGVTSSSDDAQSYIIQYGTNTNGPWTTITSDNGNHFALSSTTHYADGDVITNQLSNIVKYKFLRERCSIRIHRQFWRRRIR